MGLLSGAKLLIGHGNGGTYKNIWHHILDIAIPLKEKTYEPYQYLAIAEYITCSSPKDISLVVEISEQIEKRGLCQALLSRYRLIKESFGSVLCIVWKGYLEKLATFLFCPIVGYYY